MNTIQKMIQGYRADGTDYLKLLGCIGIDAFAILFKSKDYFYDTYNHTWVNERTIEIPMIDRLLNNPNAKMVLEVGCVTPHYLDITHRVIDKYETHPQSENIDVVDLKTDERYDLIFSISTMEHVGWDEKPKDPEKLSMAIKTLLEHLNDSGIFVMTVPMGYNDYLDGLIKRRLHKHSKFFQRGLFNTWKEVDWKDITDYSYIKCISARVLCMVELTREDIDIFR